MQKPDGESMMGKHVTATDTEDYELNHVWHGGHGHTTLLSERTKGIINMSKRSYVNLKIQIQNNCTPEPAPKRLKTTSPDEGCFSASREDCVRRTSVPFDEDVDSLLCLQDRGDDGYFSLSFEAPQDGVQSPEGVLKLGPPLFESSLVGCDSGDQNSVNQSQNQSEWESTLPLQVQVKSVVVPVIPVVPLERPPVERAVRPHIHNEEEKKRNYINAVSRHMRERPPNQGVLGELMNLMSAVAHDGSTQRPHPSDLTRRNYVQRFKPTRVSLQDYDKSLDFTYKRFAGIPKLFRRC
ncbi:unnamed protein product [Knipowitschia caucasica]